MSLMDSLFTLEETPREILNLTSDGAHIVSHEVSDKLKKKKLSPSLVNSMLGCQARWLFETYVAPEMDHNIDTPATRGSMFHKVLEDFYSQKPEDRTSRTLSECAKNVTESDDFKELASIPSAREWLQGALSNYVRMGFKPSQTIIAEVVLKGRKRKGLEVFVDGKIGDTEREILGFIDQLTVDTTTGDLIVTDYKTGSKAKHWNPKTKSEDGLSEQRQQLIYTMLLENMGYKVSGAQLIYPVAQDVVTVDLSDSSLRERCVQDVQEADKALSLAERDNTFTYSPSALCSWCPLAKVCPSATLFRNSEKCMSAYESQPDPHYVKSFISVG